MLAQAFLGLAFLLGVLVTALLASAGTLAYWQAWAFLVVFGVSTLAITIDLALRDPELLARRVVAGPVAEPRRIQQVIQTLASLSFFGVFVLAGLDRRHGWSKVPDGIVILGDVLVAFGLGVVARVFRANAYTSAIIAVEREQALVSTGPYAVVRHPMYAGAMLMMLGVPLALGSWWALLVVVPLHGVIVIRLLDEERVLARELPGYIQYCHEVRYRLAPFIW